MAILGDFEFYRGEDVALRVQILKRDGTPETIAGWALTFTARVKAADADPPSIVKVTPTAITIVAGDPTLGPLPPAGITESTGTNSVAKITIEDTDTTGLAVGEYAWDLKRLEAGVESILAIGRLRLLQEVTR